MNNAREQTLDDILKKTKAELNQDNDKKLISVTKQISKIDLFCFFNAASEMTSNRIFWTSTLDEFSLVGVGSIARIQASQNRYVETSREWQEIQEKAVIYNPYGGPGTGLVALGGMSFDPRKFKSELWESFPDSQFHIPEFTLVKHKDFYYLTINIYLTKDDSLQKVVEDIERKESYLLTGKHGSDEANLRVLNKTDIAPEQWKEAVHYAREEIRANKLEKVVMARELRLELSEEPNITSVLQKLIETQPTSYIFAFEQNDNCFVGATPERLVKVEQDSMLSMCLAGTAPRGKTEKEDNAIKENLLHDQKNLQEHNFVVEMIRQGIENECTDIEIPKKPSIYQLRNLQHLYTPVKGKLKDGTTILDIVGKLHPTPALGGTPTEKALEFIRDNELLDRGWYGAPVGWMDSNAFGEFVVAIRSGLIQGDEASLFAGCGVVADSDIEEEFEETHMKFSPILHVLEK